LIAALSFSGCFQAVTSAPANWWPLAPFYLVPGLWAIGRLRGRRALLGGWLLGFSANVTAAARPPSDVGSTARHAGASGGFGP
jgi:hypothetical protein